MGDQDPLLLAPREPPDPAVGELFGVDIVEHLLHQLTLLPRAPADAEPVAVEPERHQVAGPDRHVRVEGHLLGDIAQRSAVAGEWFPEEPNLPRAGSLESEDHPQQRRLAHPVGPDQPGELPFVHLERDVFEDGPTREGDPHLVEGEDGGVAHRCSVEVPWATAAWMAATSATIHDW